MLADEQMNEISGRIMEKMTKREQQRKINRFIQLNQYMKKHQILFTGSSLMELFPIEELRISEDIEPVIYNRAIGGFTTSDFLAHIDVMLLQPEASKIFINIGTNDISERFGADGAWLDHLAANYDRILAQLKTEQPEAEVYVMAYYPANMEVISGSERGLTAFGLRTPENMAKANTEAAKLAQKNACHFINVNACISDSAGALKKEYTTDGVHMIPAAYVQILHALKAYL